MKCPNPCRNYYWFIFYVKSLGKFCLFNSVDFVKIANRNKIGMHVGLYPITVTSKNAPAPAPNFNAIPKTKRRRTLSISYRCLNT